MRQLRASHDTTEHRDKARMIVDLSLWATGKTAKVLDRTVKLAPVWEGKKSFNNTLRYQYIAQSRHVKSISLKLLSR